MTVEVKLFAFFRENRFTAKDFSFAEPVSVGHIVDSLGIRAEEVGVTMINGRHCSLDSTVQDGDSLGIFPLIGGG